MRRVQDEGCQSLRNRISKLKYTRFVDPLWYQKRVGGMWDEMGKLQFDFLVEQGLKPEHYFLDVGCGSLRGGLHFIRYLDVGHYYGIDVDRELLRVGRKQLRKGGLAEKDPSLVEMDDFSFSSLGRSFDYALAQSVFTHLPLNSIIMCIVNIEQVLNPGDLFYATFFENVHGKRNLKPLKHSSAGDAIRYSFFDRDPYHYDLEAFRWVCDGLEMRVQYLGDWGHPRDQKMLVFKRNSNIAMDIHTDE